MKNKNKFRQTVNRGDQEIYNEGLIAGIIEMFQENQVAINLRVKERIGRKKK